MISVNAVRTMRMSILRNFQILNGKLPLMIKEDIQTGLTGDMGGLISELRNLRGELADATREQEFITGHWKELKERNSKIKSGRG